MKQHNINLIYSGNEKYVWRTVGLTDIEDLARGWGTGVLLLGVFLLADLLLSSVGMGLLAVFQLFNAVNVPLIIAWAIVYVGVLPFVLGYVAHMIVEYVRD